MMATHYYIQSKSGKKYMILYGFSPEFWQRENVHMNAKQILDISLSGSQFYLVWN